MSLCIIHSLANYVFQVALPSGITRNYAKGKHWQTTTKAKGWGNQGSLFYLGSVFEQWLHICHSAPGHPLLRSCCLQMYPAWVLQSPRVLCLPSPRDESSSLCFAAADLLLFWLPSFVVIVLNFFCFKYLAWHLFLDWT